MKARTIIRLTGIGVLACAAVIGASASGAFAGQSASGMTIGPLPALGGLEGMKGFSMDTSCATIAPFVASDNLAFGFTDGTTVSYGPGPNPGTTGSNVEGDAMLLDATTAMPTGYEGHVHYWTDNHVNPTGNNAQSWSGTTLDAHVSNGTDSIDVSGSFGGGFSASGNQSGWFHMKVTCS